MVKMLTWLTIENVVTGFSFFLLSNFSTIKIDEYLRPVNIIKAVYTIFMQNAGYKLAIQLAMSTYAHSLHQLLSTGTMTSENT